MTFGGSTLLFRLSFTLACSSVLASSAAHASAGATTAVGARACSNGQSSALGEIACEIVKAVGSPPPHALVVAAVPVSDRPLADARGLSLLLARLVAGKLGAGTVSSPEAGDLAHARSLARKHRVLIHLVPKIERGELRVTADAYPGHVSFWDRIRYPEPQATMHAFASRRLDAEIAAFLKPVPLVATTVEKSAAPGRAVALACGDADGDGSIELLVVGRQRLWLGRIRNRRFVVERDIAWSELSPVSPSPLRQPIAAATIHSADHIDAGISDRFTGVRLSPDLAGARKLSAAVPWDGIGCLSVSGTALGAARPCLPSEPSVVLAAQVADAVASTRMVTKAGKTERIFAWRSSDGMLTISDGKRRTALLENRGAQVALGDLDLDGLVEIVTTENTLDPARDAVVVHTWADASAARERLRVPAPAGVLGLAVCPPEGSGLSAVAVATGDELWILK